MSNSIILKVQLLLTLFTQIWSHWLNELKTWNKLNGSVFVALLAVWSLPISEFRCSNLVIGKFLFTTFIYFQLR